MNKSWVLTNNLYLCIMELYFKWKAVSPDSLELISNSFWFKMLDSALTRTFGNRQRGITTVGTHLSGLPLAKSKLTHNKKCHKFQVLLSVWLSLQGCGFTICPQISNYSNSTRTALVPNFNIRNGLNDKRNMRQQPKGFKQWFWATNATHPMHWGALGALP